MKILLVITSIKLLSNRWPNIVFFPDPPAPPPVTPGTPDFLCPGNVPGWVHFRGREFYLGSPQGLTWLEADAKATDAATTTIPTGHSGGQESNVSHLLQIETLEERELVHDLIARCELPDRTFHNFIAPAYVDQHF